MQDDKVAKLEQEVSNLLVQLDDKDVQLDDKDVQLDTKKQELFHVQSLLDIEQDKVLNGQQEISKLYAQLDVLKSQLDGKQQELADVKETFTSGQKWQEGRSQQMLETEQNRVNSLQEQLDTERKRVFNVQQESASLRIHVSNLQEQLKRKQEPIGQVKSVQLDTEQPRKNVQLDTIAEQIRELLTEEPGLSARAIAAKIGCSPTTASTWKKAIEQELSVVPPLHIVNE